MIAVVLRLKLLQSLFKHPFAPLAQFIDALAEIVHKFLSGDSAYRRIVRMERDVNQVVQTAENVDLPDFANACQEHELQVVLIGLHHSVEVVERPAVGALQFRLVVDVHYRAVILVNQDHDLSACLLVNFSDKPVESSRR